MALKSFIAGMKVIMNKINKRELPPEIKNVSIIGLGYVGLPLAYVISKKYKVFGVDINKLRIKQLRKGIDNTFEVKDTEGLKNIEFSENFQSVKNSDIIIVTVPTPIDNTNNPDLNPLIVATKNIAEYIKKGAIIVYESTVYPGVTEDILVPIIESSSGLKFNVDFSVGYSPERINPGDKTMGIEEITKVTSGSSEASALLIDRFYNSFIDAGTYLAPSIKVAEAAKVIENIQRDINIALVNELSIIFSKLDIDTTEVLDAAATKWNFVKYFPGLVGGHCIGVDPYYLTYRAREIGYTPHVILAGRELNDNMHHEVIERSIKALIKRKINIGNSKALILGYTFKENCPDIRNTRVKPLVYELASLFEKVDVYDPLIDLNEIETMDNVYFLDELSNQKYELVILAVPHFQICTKGEAWFKDLI